MVGKKIIAHIFVSGWITATCHRPRLSRVWLNTMTTYLHSMVSPLSLSLLARTRHSRSCANLSSRYSACALNQINCVLGLVRCAQPLRLLAYCIEKNYYQTAVRTNSSFMARVTPRPEGWANSGFDGSHWEYLCSWVQWSINWIWTPSSWLWRPDTYMSRAVDAKLWR